MSSKYQATVSTKGGKLEGDFQNGIYVFKGIPYAAPPVGELRWLPPKPAKPWTGVRPAKEFGPIAPQNPMAGGPIAHGEQAQDEDCLFLNIWTPGLDSAKRPVMVWIHGGAFTIGSGSDPGYRGGKLAAHGDVVLVTINYRLGLLGFLRLKGATDGKIPSTGNEGLLDQVAALKWVRDNIAAFGGDPKNITVFGESSGSMSISYLMVMPSAKGLFHKGILESGVINTAVTLKKANATGEYFLKTAGIKKDDVKALRALTPTQLLEMEIKMGTGLASLGDNTKIAATGPYIDGEIIPDVPTKLARKGSAKNIPTIIGTNLDECKFFGVMEPGFDKMDEAEMMKRLVALVPAESAGKVAAAYRKALQKRGEPVTPANILSAIQTDFGFRVPALELVEAQRDNKQLVYSYLFTWKSPVMGGILGACHALEVGFVFGKYDDRFCGSGPDADKLSRCIQDAWLAFARTGDPSCQSIGEWPVYGERRLTMMLGKDCHVEEAPYEDERRAWEKVTHKPTMP